MSKYYPYAIIIVVTAVTTMWLSPTRVKTVEVEKIVEKIVEVEREREDTVIDRETNIIERPDGTREIEIIEREETVTDRERLVEEDRTTEEVKTKETIRKAPQWLISAQVNPMDLPDTAAILTVQRRILGPVFAGASVHTHLDEFYLAVSFQF